MDKEEFTNKIQDAQEDKDTMKAVQLEKTWEERWEWIEANANSYYEDKGHKEGREEAIDDIIKSMLNEQIAYETISKVTGKSIDYIKSIETKE